MSEAKVPDSKICDWKSLDIFLFCNGQQSSPPRKYHLVTDQLDWWKVTLNFLAKAQYGSLYSMIDLYTIDGKKIETPMQLSHNTTYVAVAPPDPFINAGYEKYLIKATRSWEKGQERRSSNTAIKPEEHIIVNDNSNSDTRSYGLYNNTKEIRDGSVTLKTIVASMVDNQASLIVKPEATVDKNLSSVKPPDKINRSLMQHSTTPKSNTVLPSPPRTRKPSLKRRDSVKIITERSDRASSSGTSNNKIPIRNRSLKPNQRQRNSLPETVLTKVEEIENEVVSPFSSKELNDKNTEQKKTNKKNLIHNEDNSIISHLYKNDYIGEHSIAIAIDPDTPLSDNVNRQGGIHELFDENLQRKDKDYENMESENVIETAITSVAKNNTDDQSVIELRLPSPIVLKVTEPENDVALINKEGTVNLKLNIEIWNSSNESKIIPNNVLKKNPKTIVTQEKESQVHIEVKSSEYDNTLHKIIANEMSGNDGNHKAIIVKCACFNLGSDETKNIMFPVNNGNSNFMVFLPVLNLNEDCKRCDCRENKENQSTSVNSSVDYPVKKKTSCMSLYKERAEKIFSYSEITSRNNSTEIKVDTNSVHDKNETTVVKRKSVAIKEDQELFPQTEKPKDPNETPEHFKVPLGLDKSEFIVIHKESTGILHKSLNKFTQTEWCDILLEVKLQNDGHYSFRMPPLDTLKKYKL